MAQHCRMIVWYTVHTMILHLFLAVVVPVRAAATAVVITLRPCFNEQHTTMIANTSLSKLKLCVLVP
jgi:hypothetical protein